MCPATSVSPVWIYVLLRKLSEGRNSRREKRTGLSLAKSSPRLGVLSAYESEIERESLRAMV